MVYLIAAYMRRAKVTIERPKKGIRWAFSPDPTRGMIPLDPHKWMLLGLRRKQTPAVDWKYASLGAVMASGSATKSPSRMQSIR